jgi:hypothetical protein
MIGLTAIAVAQHVAPWCVAPWCFSQVLIEMVDRRGTDQQKLALIREADAM